jgi:membrane AbrB-like protein
MDRSLVALWREFRGGLAALTPSRFPYARFALALSLGVIGGLIFRALNLPLPWMLGPISILTLASLAGLPVSAPTVVRPPMTIVIGILLGSAFSPGLLSDFPRWAATILGLIVFIAAAGAVCTLYFWKIGGCDPTTAYFCGMPGGLVEMVVFGEAKGGDARQIALVHSARILIVVLSLPFLVQMLEGVVLGARPLPGPSILNASLSADLWLLACAALGVMLGHVARLPGKFLLGPMLVSAVFHIAGLTTFVPPWELLLIAQLVLGTTIGCRFAGGDTALVLRTLALSLGASVVLLLVTAVFAIAAGYATGRSPILLLLAYSPGGLAEMGLIALALNLDVAFVAAHHVVRIMFVLMAAAPAFDVMSRWMKRPEAPD